MKRRLPFLLLGLLVALATSGCRDRQLAGEDAGELLRAVRQAKREVSLKGELDTNVRVGGQYVAGHATVHRGDDRMDLTFTDGKAKGVKIIEQQGDVWQIAPNGKAVRRLPRSPLDQMPAFGKHAVVEVSKGETVAGRRTDKIIIRPRRHCKARLEIWADADNRFPLASDRYNNDGELVASTRYKTIDFSVPAPKPVDVPEAKLPRRVWQRAEKTDDATAAKVLGRAPVRPGYVPPGYKAQGQYVHKGPRGDTVELRYSDDVRLLHIMQTKLPRHGQTGHMTPEQEQARKAVWETLSEEEREAIRSKNWDKIPPQRREAIKRQWQQSQRARGPEQRPDKPANERSGKASDERSTKANDQQKARRDAWESLSEEQRQAVRERRQQSQRKPGDSQPSADGLSKEQQEARKQRGESLTEEQRQALKERRQQSQRRPGASQPSADGLSKEQQEARKQRGESLTEEQREALKERGQQRRGQPPGAGAGRQGEPQAGAGRPGQGQGQWSRDMMRSRLRGKVTRFRVGDVGVVVTGDASAEELRKIADSMKESKTDF